MQEFLDAIKTGLTATDKNDIFFKPDYSTLESACVSFLKERGFRILKPIEYSAKNIKNIDQLITMFYNLLRIKHPDWAIFINEDRDRKIAARLMAERKKANDLSNKEALQQCAEMVLAVLDNEHRFKFKYSYDFSVFGQENLKWVSITALQIVNENRAREEDRRFKLYEDMFLQKFKGQAGMIEDIDKLLEASQNGKEKGKIKRNKSRTTSTRRKSRS